MKRKRPLSRSALALCAALVLVAAPRIARAQADTTGAVHATLRWWDEQRWLTIFDRGGAFFGRSSDRGILQRFNEKMDVEYHIDVMSYDFSLTDTYEWYRNQNGVRFWTGSINHLRLVEQAQFKAAVRLGGSWAADAQFTRQQTLQVQRNLVWLQLRTDVSGGRGRIFLRATLNANKPESDLEIGTTWKPGRGRVTLAFGALDPFSDLIYQELGAPVSFADSAIDYLSHPFTARVALDMPLGRNFRAEAYGLVLTPTRVAIESQTTPGEGFVQNERYAYAGGLLEWAPSARTAVGVLGTWVRARLDRTPLAAGRAEDDFDLTERTRQAGLYAIHRFSGRFWAETRALRIRRNEDRLRPDTTVAPAIDYEDVAWAGRTTLSYRARSGFRADLGLDFLARDISEPDRVPGFWNLSRDNFRLRFGFGWQLPGTALFLAGADYDLDDSRGWGFDGAWGRFALYW
jgi:hypothetical protein